MTDRASGAFPPHPVERKILLRFEGVSFSYGPLRVLSGASFHIHQGEFVALLGPNGSGKTTILKLLLGLEKPESGTIEIERDRTGYVPQQALTGRSFPISVERVVRMGRLRPLSRRRTPEDRAAVREALARMEIEDLARRQYGSLSGGQRRRVLAARALAARPEILILDEPTANMDLESEERFFTTLGDLKAGRDGPGVTILIVTHGMDFVSSLVDRVLCIGGEEAGRVVQHRLDRIPGTSRVLHGEGIDAGACRASDGGGHG
ncbi:MAG: metal ABC transporter ATP-binding protein [Treponema sp.]|nr:metal ABC transporter ATP-binding protein [Treponema sp.]